MSTATATEASKKPEISSAEARFERNVAVVTIITPFIGLIVAIVLLMQGNYLTTTDLVLFLTFYAITTYGLTMGYHRLFTHKSFRCVPAVKAALCIAGSMAAQGPVIFWVACHRKHHMFSDEAEDPHSPTYGGGGFRGLMLGWWHSHMGWMFNHTPENYFKLAPDLLRDKTLMTLTRLYFVWIAAGIIIPGIIGGLVAGNMMGFVTGMIWGGFVRIFFVHHTTWSINSVCHMFGAAPFESEDESRNNVVCALLTFGEGWHNNHHAFPTSARHGLMWWQLDMVYILIKVLAAFRLVSDIRLPEPELMKSRLRSLKSKVTEAIPAVEPAKVIESVAGSVAGTVSTVAGTVSGALENAKNGLESAKQGLETAKQTLETSGTAVIESVNEVIDTVVGTDPVRP